MAFADDYIDVPTRIAEFREKYPKGSLQPADLSVPYRIESIGDQIYIAVVAAAYRAPDDSLPGIGMAYEVFPGKTNFTRGSELQNAETSAWGRAIVAALAADTRKGIASAEEVRNRQAERSPDEDTLVAIAQLVEDAQAAETKEAFTALWKEAADAGWMTVVVKGVPVGRTLTAMAERFKAQPETES